MNENKLFLDVNLDVSYEKAIHSNIAKSKILSNKSKLFIKDKKINAILFHSILPDNETTKIKVQETPQGLLLLKFMFKYVKCHGKRMMMMMKPTSQFPKHQHA